MTSVHSNTGVGGTIFTGGEPGHSYSLLATPVHQIGLTDLSTHYLRTIDTTLQDFLLAMSLATVRSKFQKMPRYNNVAS